MSTEETTTTQTDAATAADEATNAPEAEKTDAAADATEAAATNDATEATDAAKEEDTKQDKPDATEADAADDKEAASDANADKAANDASDAKEAEPVKKENPLPYSFKVTANITGTTNETFVVYEINFTVTETKMEWKQYYRYSELRQMHLNLCTSAQTIKAPALPEFAPRKRFSFSRTSKAFVTERQAALNTYLTALDAYLVQNAAVVPFFEQSFSFSFDRFVKAHDNVMIDYMLSSDSAVEAVNKADRSGATALHYAVALRSDSIIEKLLERLEGKITLDTVDSHGWNPLSLARYLADQSEQESVERKIYELLSSHFNKYQSAPEAPKEPAPEAPAEAPAEAAADAAEATEATEAADEAQEEKKQDQAEAQPEAQEQKEQKEEQPRGLDAVTASPAFVRIPLHYSKDFVKEKRHFLVLINPASGKGKAPKIWESFLQTIFDHCSSITYDAIKTQKQGHAEELCQDLDLGKYDTIVAVGGDGTMSEVLNGLNKHADRENALNTAVCGIPAGSGNAIGLELADGDIFESCRRLLDGIYMSFDTYLVQQLDEPDMIGFVSTQWGILASVDFESESMRWMGSARFNVKAVSEILSKANYPCRIFYKPQDSEEYVTWKQAYDKKQEEIKAQLEKERIEKEKKEQEEKEKREREEKEQKEKEEKEAQDKAEAEKAAAEKAEKDAKDSKDAPEEAEAGDAADAGDAAKTEEAAEKVKEDAAVTTEANEEDAKPDAAAEEEADTKEKPADAADAADAAETQPEAEKAADATDATEATEATESKKDEVAEEKEVKGEDWEKIESKDVPDADAEEVTQENLKMNPKREWWQDLPFTKEKAPEGWCFEEGELGMIMVTNLGMIGEGLCAGGSDLKINDHSLKIVWTVKTGRADGLKMLLAVEDGSHLKMNGVFQSRVDEAVIEPLADKPEMDVDGERRPVKPTFLKIMPGRCLLAC